MRWLAAAVVVAPFPAMAQVPEFHDDSYTADMFLRDFAFTAVLFVLAALALYITFRETERRFRSGPDLLLKKQGLRLVVVVVTVVTVLVLMPLASQNRTAILGLIGIALSGLIALSSANIAGNALAGLLLRPIWKLAPGQYIRIGEVCGRISRLELLRMELTTETGAIIAVPATHILSHPLEQTTSETAVISAEVSLGYDVAPATVEPLLLKAAVAAGIRDARTLVDSLGDFSVVYRVLGRPGDPDRPNESRSSLNRAVIETLQAEGIDIASPTLVSARMEG